MRRCRLVAVLLTLATPTLSAQHGTAVSAARLRADLYRLASDSMMGREPGSLGNARAADYVAAEFHRLGLEPAGDSGTYFQPVPLADAAVPPDIAYPARNVVAILRGRDPRLRHEYVSLTAHNDHVGFNRTPVDHDSIRAYNRVIRPAGADSPNRKPSLDEWTRIHTILDSLRALRPARPDSIRNGADDDGSGTVALLELARVLSHEQVRPRRSILFVSHTAEEYGLVGSAWYTDHPTVPLDSIVAEIDSDMIGRGDATDVPGGGPAYLEVVGAWRLSRQFGDLLEQVNAAQPRPFEFNLAYDAPGHPLQYYCRADHYNYARYGIPSASLSRGEHLDYHQVTDEPQYIDYETLARVTSLVRATALRLANQDTRPALDVAKPDPKAPCRQ